MDISIKMPYARGYETIKVDSQRVKAVLEQKHEIKETLSQSDIVSDSLRNPIRS